MPEKLSSNNTLVDIDQADIAEALEATMLVPASEVLSGNPYRSDLLVHSFSEPLARNVMQMCLTEHMKRAVQEIRITSLKQKRTGLSVDLLIDAQDG